MLWAFDESAWASALNYSQMPLELSRQMFDGVRKRLIHHAALYYQADGHREFVHSGTGIRTLKDEFDKVAAHNEHHLRQIEQAVQAAAQIGTADVRR